MARKKGGVNVSQAIRDYLKANKDVGPTAAAEAISKQVGKKISPTYVSNIKSTLNGTPKNKRRKARRPGRQASSVVAAPSGSNGTVELKTIVVVKELLASVGADKARQLI